MKFKMWTRKSNDGSVFWSEAAKLKLVELVKRNPDALTGDRLSPKKSAAWKNVYNSLIKAGMPRSSIERVKKCWSRIHLAAKAQHTEQIRKYKREGKLIPLSQLNQNVINFLNEVNSNSNLFAMPKPITVKQEPIDPLEETAMYDCDMNPVVVLNRINMNDDSIKVEPSNQPLPSNSSSGKYWQLMEQIAETELNLKLTQRKNEEERIEREREIYQKNMILLDLKIKVQEMQIGALQGQSLFE